MDLISQLSQNLKPVKPMRSLKLQTLFLALFFLFIVALSCLYWYLRKGEIHFPSGRPLVETVLLLMAALYGIYLAVLSISPHFSSVRFSKKSVGFIALWFLVLLLSFVTLYFSKNKDSLIALQYNTWLCPMVILTSAVPISIIGFFYLWRGSILFARNTFVYLSLSSFSFGAFGLSFICPWTDPLHEILWHVLPVFILTILIAGLFLLIFKATNKFFFRY